MPEQHLLTLLENTPLTDTVFLLRLSAGALAETAVPGQFLHVRCRESSVLRRPLSICDVSDGVLTIAAEVRGRGDGVAFARGRRARRWTFSARWAGASTWRMIRFLQSAADLARRRCCSPPGRPVRGRQSSVFRKRAASSLKGNLARCARKFT